MLVPWLIAMSVAYAVARFPSDTDSAMSAVRAGFICCQRQLKPMKKAKM